MENKKEKKGLFQRLMRSKKVKKSPCCGGFEIEEIPEENSDTDNEKKTIKDKDNS